MTNRSHRKVILLVGFSALVFLLAWKFLLAPDTSSPASTNRLIVEKAKEDVVPAGIVVTESSSAPAAQFSQSNRPIKTGDKLLMGYADPALSPQNDMQLIAQTISTFFIINKQASQLPLSANGEWAAALNGRKLGTEPWISTESPALDQQGRLIDRWGTPLHFHSLGGKIWEIRSAGPDRKYWTPDDILGKTNG
ncbi:MAG: hypothetical protein HC767_02725 [Akkermansiaceae bacterium]|nr:hypothetical protein [Akkermansiaceae bacterium]